MFAFSPVVPVVLVFPEVPLVFVVPVACVLCGAFVVSVFRAFSVFFVVVSGVRFWWWCGLFRWFGWSFGSAGERVILYVAVCATYVCVSFLLGWKSSGEVFVDCV